MGYRTFCVFFNVNEASVYRALLAFIFSEKIFEGGMTRRDSRHCPQFLDSGNSSEFSISGGPVCSKARDSVLYEQSFLAGFPLFKQRGINYPPTFVGFETKFCFKCLPILNVIYMAGRSALKLETGCCVSYLNLAFKKGAV